MFGNHLSSYNQNKVMYYCQLLLLSLCIPLICEPPQLFHPFLSHQFFYGFSNTAYQKYPYPAVLWMVRSPNDVKQGIQKNEKIKNSHTTAQFWHLSFTASSRVPKLPTPHLFLPFHLEMRCDDPSFICQKSIKVHMNADFLEHSSGFPWNTYMFENVSSILSSSS